MCNFKSGVILKTRCVVAEGDDDSHSNLLNQLGIEDTTENAMRKFVRAELIPSNNEWWTDPESWKFHVDQDIVPEWFENDKVRYEQEFRAAVTDWWHKHCLIGQKIDELKCGYYLLWKCEVKRLLNDVRVLMNNSTVQNMCDNSTVRDMCASSMVWYMRDSSMVWYMRGSSTVQNMCDNSTVRDMCASSTVWYMRDSSMVWYMRDSSTVRYMCDNSTVQDMCGSSMVQNMRDNSTVRYMWSSSTVQNMCGSSTVRNMRDSSTIVSNINNDIAISSDRNCKVVKQ